MLTREEINWLKRKANELNNLLQEISSSAYRIEQISGNNEEIRNYLALINNSSRQAGQVTAGMLERAGRVAGSRTTLRIVQESLPDAPSNRVTPAIQPLNRATNHVSAASGTISPFPTQTSAKKADDELTRRVEAMGGQIENAGSPGPLLLMVDDEAAVLLLAKMMLADAGYRVVSFTEPARALEAYKQIDEYVSLVLLDFKMPGMDGEVLFEGLYQHNPKLRAVLVSGYADQDRVQRMIEKGLCGVLEKPYTSIKLVETVEKHLR